MSSRVVRILSRKAQMYYSHILKPSHPIKVVMSGELFIAGSTN